MTERGVYASINRGRQLLRFDGMQYGSITPTDIDGLIEYHDKLWIVYEAKLEDKEVSQGQKLALERFIWNVRIAHKHGIALIVVHKIKDANKDIYLKDCEVRELITTENMKWRPPKFRITVKEITDTFIRYYGNGGN